MEVLAAFIRDHSREQWPPARSPAARDAKTGNAPRHTSGRHCHRARNPRHDRQTVALYITVDLHGAVLARADLIEATLADAFLARADLTGAILTNATLASATLTGAHLDGATLTGADLAQRDHLTGAHLDGATLTRRGPHRRDPRRRAPRHNGVWRQSLRSISANSSAVFKFTSMPNSAL